MAMGKFEAKKICFYCAIKGGKDRAPSLSVDNLHKLKRLDFGIQKNHPRIWLCYTGIAFNLFVLLKLAGNEGEEVHFSTFQKQRILNVDETKFSLDGSDGGCGG
jgi:hypothetical protein